MIPSVRGTREDEGKQWGAPRTLWLLVDKAGIVRSKARRTPGTGFGIQGWGRSILTLISCESLSTSGSFFGHRISPGCLEAQSGPSWGFGKLQEWEVREIINLHAPFLLECISLLPDLCFVYWKNQHIGSFPKENVVASDPETYIYVSLSSNSRGSEFT